MVCLLMLKLVTTCASVMPTAALPRTIMNVVISRTVTTECRLGIGLRACGVGGRVALMLDTVVRLGEERTASAS